jgi:hypothetical protein
MAGYMVVDNGWCLVVEDGRCVVVKDVLMHVAFESDRVGLFWCLTICNGGFVEVVAD